EASRREKSGFQSIDRELCRGDRLSLIAHHHVGLAVGKAVGNLNVYLSRANVVDISSGPADGDGHSIERCWRVGPSEVAARPCPRRAGEVRSIDLDKRARCRGVK